MKQGRNENSRNRSSITNSERSSNGFTLLWSMPTEKIHTCIPRGHCIAVREGSKGTVVEQSLRFHDNGNSGAVETALYTALNDPAIMLASLSGEKVVALNSPAESKHLCTIVKEVLKGNSVRSACLLWDLKMERVIAERAVAQLKYQYQHFSPLQDKMLENDGDGVQQNVDYIEEKKNSSRKSSIGFGRDSIDSQVSQFDESQSDPMKETAIHAIVSHQCNPKSIKITSSVKMFEEKNTFFWWKKETTYIYNVCFVSFRLRKAL